MAGLNLSPRKLSNTKLKLSELNPHLMCVLCGGYYIDATTIVECLHSFCRSCIVKHLERSKYCPICEVQVHKTKPLINIRPDKTLQDIVYKLVPGLFANEMRNRRRFYGERPHYIKPNDVESSGEVVGERKIYVNDENITFSLVYHEGPAPTAHDDTYREYPPPTQNERRYFKCPTGVCVHHLKKLLRAKYELSDSNYKLEIYFKDQELLDDFTLLDVAYIYLWKTKGSLNMTFKIFESIVKRQKVEEETEKAITETGKQSEESLPKQPESVGTPKEEEKPTAEEPRVPEKEPEPSKSDSPETNVNPETKPPEEREPGKENGLNEVQLQISESGVMSVSKVENSEIVKTVEETKVTNNSRGGKSEPSKGNGEVKPQAEEKKPVTPYKSIRASPKTWNPVIPKEKLRPTLMKNSEEPRKPSKFFKMRNAPRFLGNPSSGVKPMYAGSSPEKPGEKKSEKSLSRIVQIDPKTLRTIEKGEMNMSLTPSAPNLLTSPYIPNNNHFLFSEVQLLPPNAGNYSPKEKPSGTGRFKPPAPNGTYPPVCFPTPEHTPPDFYPFGNLTKPQSLPFPGGDRMDPLLRASRMSPFGSLTDFNAPGFHSSLPPSISLLYNPYHHFRKTSQCLEDVNIKEESTKETKSCDDSLNVKKEEEEEEEEEEEKKRKEKEEEEEEEKEKSEEEKKEKSEEEKKEKSEEKEKEKSKEEEKEKSEEEKKEKESEEENKKKKKEEEEEEEEEKVNGETSLSALKTESKSEESTGGKAEEKQGEKDESETKETDNDKDIDKGKEKDEDR